ncbi:MAG: DUF2974 domain-containing protein [Clostridia bacterium]|nr:DUF2974 domain-containing protein [Clostridia bacterium]
MSNIVDYLIWRGDLPVSKEYPFNVVDSMILARFSYLIFERIDIKPEETIESISKKMSVFKNEDFKYNGDMSLIKCLGKSNRFKDMLVTDFIEKSDISTEKQFGAITIHISSKEMYVSFEGTDKTINGWKEDFNLAFLENVPAQMDGVEYVKKIMTKYKNKNARIGGHSKGGNVAIYSAIATVEDLHNRIISIDNFDGPGFCKSVLKKFENSDIWNKVSTYIPQDSVIGRLLDHKEKCTVVYSVEKGIYQHDIYSWQIVKDNTVIVDEVTDSSELINGALTEWLENTMPEQRKMFFDQIFDLLYAVDVTSTIDMKANLIKKAPELIRAYRNVDDDDKKTISEMVRMFIKSYFSQIKENEARKLNTLQERIEQRHLRDNKELPSAD